MCRPACVFMITFNTIVGIWSFFSKFLFPLFSNKKVPMMKLYLHISPRFWPFFIVSSFPTTWLWRSRRISSHTNSSSSSVCRMWVCMWISSPVSAFQLDLSCNDLDIEIPAYCILANLSGHTNVDHNYFSMLSLPVSTLTSLWGLLLFKPTLPPSDTSIYPVNIKCC